MDFKKTKKYFFEKSIKYISFRPRSEKEVIDYLNRKIKPTDFKINLINEIVFDLKKDFFLNDVEFVSWWIDQRNYFKPRGINLLKIELQKKGISKEIIDDYFSLKKQDDFEIAKKLLSSKKSVLKKEKVKIIEFLIRKGFSYSVAKNAFEDLV